MAYVSNEKKAKIAAAVKTALNIPEAKGWKVTLAVRHRSSIVSTIQKAPKRIWDDYVPPESGAHFYVNEYHLQKNWKDETLTVLQALVNALNTDNFDKSDIQSDYFHVGHYVDIQFGRYDKPLELV